MRLLVGTAIIFFGTLMAAAALALGAPSVMDLLAPGRAQASQAPLPGPLHATGQTPGGAAR